MIISISNQCQGYYFLALLFFNISTMSSLEMVAPVDYCDADDDMVITGLFAQVHNLTENIAKLNHQFQGFEENQRKLLTEIEQLHHKQSGRQDTVIQRRMDGSVDFHRTWDEFKQGFGHSSGEFFIGLDKLHKLTNSGPHELLIVLEDWEDERRYAKYNNFVVGSESEKYELQSLGNYTGTAGDSLTYHLGQKFTTKDQDNDKYTAENCAVVYRGAWWHNNCLRSNLNGPYKKGQVPDDENGNIIEWKAFKGNKYSLKFVEMTIRPS